MKKFIIIIIILALAGGTAAYVLRSNGWIGASKTAAQDEASKKIKVERGNIDLKVSTTGRVTSNLDVEIKSKASGQIIRLPFDISDQVTSGALLTELDPIDENRNVALRQVALTSARAKFAQSLEQLKIAQINLDTGTSSAQAELSATRIRDRDAQMKLARAEQLFQKSLVSKEELDTARTDAANAANTLKQAEVKNSETMILPRTLEMRKQDIMLQQASVKQAEVDLENAEQRLTETKIYASMNGVISARTVQSGQIIASGISNVGGGTTLMILSDMSKIFINATIDEVDIGKVKLGQTAIITADAFPGKRFRGQIVRIATKGVNSNNVVTFEVKILIQDENSGLLKPEMTANVEIQADRREDVVLLPNEVVQYGRGGYYVEIYTDDKNTTRTPVKTGLTDGLNTEITEGIAEGQNVALSGSIQSRWARSQGGPGGAGGGASLTRGMQMSAFRMSGAGGGGGGGGRH